MTNNHRKCSICGKPIVLYPSAAERARRFGGVPSDYLDLFTAHSDCALKKREAETLELIKRHHQMTWVYAFNSFSRRYKSITFYRDG